MNKQHLETYLSKRHFNWFELGFDFSKDHQFITSLYSQEEKPIFEHSSYHVLSYLKFQSSIFALNHNFGATILVLRKENVFLFTPLVEDFKTFENFTLSFTHGLNLKELEIQNVSEQWLNTFNEKSSQRFKNWCFIKPRSKEEVVYSVPILCELPGKKYAKLRYARNKLLNSGQLKFKKITRDNLPDALAVLDLWQKVQGFKYSKDKYQKERFVFEIFVGLSLLEKNLIFEIGYVQRRPLSVIALYKNPNKDKWGTLYLVKGINREIDGGVHGVSDATYSYGFLKAQGMGIERLNDGELGEEKGTRTHKLGFGPIEFLKSFDIFFKKNVGKA